MKLSGQVESYITKVFCRSCIQRNRAYLSLFVKAASCSLWENKRPQDMAFFTIAFAGFLFYVAFPIMTATHVILIRSWRVGVVEEKFAEQTCSKIRGSQAYEKREGKMSLQCFDSAVLYGSSLGHTSDCIGTSYMPMHLKFVKEPRFSNMLGLKQLAVTYAVLTCKQARYVGQSLWPLYKTFLIKLSRS